MLDRGSSHDTYRAGVSECLSARLARCAIAAASGLQAGCTAACAVVHPAGDVEAFSRAGRSLDTSRDAFGSGGTVGSPRFSRAVACARRQQGAWGVPPPPLDSGLERAARAHGHDLLVNDAFTHEFIKKGAAYPFSTWIAWYYSHTCAGENLAEGQPTLTAVSAVRLWLESPDHRANMLSRAYRTMGVALLSSSGTVIAVNTFGDC
jgi:hypothetical protein